ncbi:hypothetical protein AC249_AIPGENE28511 [Exaiptasia diaphana]|nr:hypothetical protein AC249_AIPGENE28511 [Exaiptasia diaphana]
MAAVTYGENEDRSEVQLFRISKSNISKEIGDNISLIWEYNVTTNRDAEFKSTSPIWFFDKNGTESKIAFEDQFETPKWKWTISNDCPEQFLKPKQRIHKEGKATLFITNLSLSDSGKYTCKIELISGSDLSSSVQLFVEDLFLTAPELWNSIPENVLAEKSMRIFKQD